MSLDAGTTTLVKHGTVTVHPDKQGQVQITAEGFEGHNATVQGRGCVGLPVGQSVSFSARVHACSRAAWRRRESACVDGLLVALRALR